MPQCVGGSDCCVVYCKYIYEAYSEIKYRFAVKNIEYVFVQNFIVIRIHILQAIFPNIFAAIIETLIVAGPTFLYTLLIEWGTAVAQWLSSCITNRKVAGSIPAGVSGNFH